jgi:lipoprotein-releasing system permease protein
MSDTTNGPARTRPFSGFEWQIAWRYLRARRKEGGISVIAGYALVGVMLGVATLIVV